MKKYLKWGIVLALSVGVIGLYVFELTRPTNIHNDNTGVINGWLVGIETYLPAATQTVVASYTPLPICATEAAQEAGASIPAWWPFGH